MRKQQYIFYLDQFSVSEMVFGKGIWETIRTLLVNAVESGKVICPIPLEHFIETAGLERNKAIQQDQFFKSISHGRSFYPWEYIAANEIILYTKFKKNKRILASYIRDLNGDYDLENETTYQKHRQIREEFLSKKDKDVLNYIRQLSRDNNGANVDKASLSKEEKKERRRQRNKLEANMEIMKEALAFHNVKPYIDLFREICIGKKLQTNLLHLRRPEEIIALILCQKRFTGRNFFSASNEFQKNLFANIPSLNTYYSLKTYYSNNQMVEKANDDIDWERIASGIFISDIMLIDWRQKCAIQAMGIDKKYRTELYSNRHDDVITLKDKLEQINME